MTQSYWPKLKESRWCPNRTGGIVSCRFVVVSVIVVVCIVFEPNLSINRINSFLFINIGQTARLSVFKKTYIQCIHLDWNKKVNHFVLWAQSWGVEVRIRRECFFYQVTNVVHGPWLSECLKVLKQIKGDLNSAAFEGANRELTTRTTSPCAFECWIDIYNLRVLNIHVERL